MARNLNNIRFSFRPYVLRFKFEAGTSRGVLTEKTSYLVSAYEAETPIHVGLGEAGPLPKLSIDDLSNFDDVLAEISVRLSGSSISGGPNAILDWVSSQISNLYPSIRFAFETALLDLYHGGKRKVLDSDFYDRAATIPINGLIWMGKKEMMLAEIERKLGEGYSCIKMKIGAIDFDEEIALLSHIRGHHNASKITLRVDANGAFLPSEAAEKLRKLSDLEIHSIEQPIKAGQLAEMGALCRANILPIALDEELIGLESPHVKADLLDRVRPQFIILKPSLHGGIRSCKEWIQLAEERQIGWWMTSALESNIGLNAIAQFASCYRPQIPQGLGTGQLYHNNIESPLRVEKGYLRYDPQPSPWGI